MRRIAAIVLSELACELACREHQPTGPFAVIVDDATHPTDEPLDRTATLHAVDRQAWHYGARPGQRASQAAAYVSQLNIIHITRARVFEALGAMAEVALGFGTNAALTLDLVKGQLPQRDEAKAATLRYPMGAGAGPYDTVWLDITGCAGLVGGEDQLRAELGERARELGHHARVAIADGPRIAQALARWAPGSLQLATPGHNHLTLQELPVAALPLDPAMITWLGKLGILRIDDLAQLDRSRLSHRLGPAARDLLELIAGRDDVPLCAYQPARSIVESITFEHEIESTEPLMFVLRGLASRAIARLTARGEACARTCIQLAFDPSVIALTNQNRSTPLATTLDLELDLPVPLSREGELLRALSAKLETAVLDAPVVGLALVLDALTEQNRPQLELGGKTGVDPSALPTLLAELDAHLGPHRVGVLEIVDHHRPEARSKLVPIDDRVMRSRWVSSATDNDWLSELPNRILPQPIHIPHPDRGALLMIDKHTFTVDRLRHTQRLDHIDWWSPDPLSRDYVRAWMSCADDPKMHVSEAWLYIDRNTGKTYLHGWFE